MTAWFETDLGEQPIAQFVPQWAQSDAGKPFIIPASGGGASGGDSRNSTNLTGNPWAKGQWNMTQQGQIMIKDPARADRLAKSAGHAAAAGARMENAR
jgi:hypothetical protein